MNQTGNDQEIPLLSTKFYMPVARPGLVSRVRLLQRLEAGLQQRHGLLLIAAPAGYGKTTLAAAWLSEHATAFRPGRKTTWLTLDEAENEPARFIACVRAAFAQVGLDLGQRAQRMVERGPSFAPAAVGAALLEDLAHAMVADTPHLLVLDDYHRIQNSVLHALVQFLVEHLPPPFHLVLLTREDPPLPLARWRVQNRITELRTKDLRFTVDETTEFFHHSMSLDLSAELLSLLAMRTEGWAAGLQLAALSMQNHADPAAFVQYFAGDDRQVVDYLGDEVLARQPAPLLRFLLCTSILDRMCGELCEALLPNLQDAAGSVEAVDNSLPMSIGQRILEALERRNLFVTPLDNRRHWYRYHHLFADLLRHRLQVSVDATTIAELHRRAARWCAEHGLATEAVMHALAAGDSDLAAELVERALAASATWSGGHVGMWRAWWRALPSQTFTRRPLLCLRISRALYLAGHIEEAEHLLDEAEHALKKAPESYANVVSLQAQAAVHRAAVAAMRGETRHAIDATEAALPQLPQEEKLARARAFDTLGMAYELCGDLDRAIRAYWEASTLAEAAGVQYLVVNARCEAAMVQFAQGQLHQALQTCDAVIDLMAAEDATAPPLGLAYAIRGEIWREQNRLEAAEASLLAGIERSHTGGITDDLRHEYLFLARLRCAQGEYTHAHIALQQVDALLQDYGIPRLSSIVEAHRVRIWLAEGWLAPAVRWAETYALHTATEYRRDFEELTLARVWLAARSDAAVALLERLRVEAEAGQRTGCVIESYALLSLAYAQGGKAEAARAALDHALALAAPAGYARVFLDEGQPMLDLLHRVAGSDGAGPYAGRLLARSQPQAHPAAQPDTAAQPVAIWREVTDDANQTLREPLTARELEVLALLARRFTNDEIARELVVSLPTVKSHVAHIYAKLGVSGRKEAVACAARLGILSA